MNYVYAVTNDQDGSVYYGITKDVVRRWNGHLRHVKTGKWTGQNHLYQAIRASSNWATGFTFEVLPVCFDTREEAEEMEVHLIANARIKGWPCYNIRDGGDGGDHSAETKTRISANMDRDAVSAAALEQWKNQSKDQVRNMGRMNTGTKAAEAWRKRREKYGPNGRRVSP